MDKHIEPVQPFATVGPYTWADFVALPDDDRRELIDGHLIEVDVPTRIHERIIARLIFFLMEWAKKHGGDVIASGYKVRINPRRGVMPDVQLFRAENDAGEQNQALERGRPDIAVEVISPSSRTIDNLTKFNWYAAKGVPEYWIVDPDARVLHRHILEGSHYASESYGDGDVLAPKTFRGLKIPLSELWAKPGAKKRKR